MQRGASIALAAAVVASVIAAPAARAQTIRSGALTATATASPFSIVFDQRGGQQLVARAITPGATFRLRAAGEGVIALEVNAPPGTQATRVEFAAPAGEGYFGFGERSDAVDRRGLQTESYVADGPVRSEDREYVKASVPPWADRERDDATYYPVPWLLSSRGYGVLIDEDVTSRFDTSAVNRWVADVDGRRLALRVFAGPTPAGALRRFTAATGRQPAPQAPWTFGPWFQTGQPNVVPVEEERAITRAQRQAGAPVSVAETQMHYLPCGAHKGREAAERERTESFHRDGLARLVYFNPLLCASYTDVFGRAAAAGVLQKGPAGEPFTYPAFVGGSGPLGFTQEPLAQFDFTNPATEDFYAGLVREAVEAGADGWMEDFGESTPPSIRQYDGSTGDAAHNRYPTDYHCALQRIAQRFGRPLVRFQRSGWTGAARCAEVVWGGDPSTVWGFDGISSAVTQMLSMGLSGVSRWGTDIGGYVSFGAGFQSKPGATEEERLTPELLTRWIELGALVPVMRTKRTGIAIPSYARPQVFEPGQLPVWRRMTELHLQLNPYLRAADDEHRASGLPIARHLLLAYPRLARARETHNQYLLGPDLLAAPVTAPGRREQRVWLPPGRWVDWWRSASFVEPWGSYRLERLRLLKGGGDVTLPAPLGQPPLLLRAGAVLPLIGANIDTLSPYGREAGLTRLADRANRLRLIAVPRGRTRARLPDGGRAHSAERRRGGRWVLRLRARRRTLFTVEASLGSLRRPFRPRRVLLNGRKLHRKRWRYARRANRLRVRVRGRRAVLDVRRR